ncbi:MAG: ArnT family glycosyltransferase [Gemmatimonadaceae bacterium]
MASIASQPSERPPHLVGWLLGILLLRLAFAAAVPLVPDEAYYWTWSRQLAGGYFDHPPVIAWLIAGGTALFGDTPLGVRLLPNVAGTLATAAIAWTADVLAGPRAARFALLAFAVMPVAAVGMILATPDAPLLFGIAWTLCCVTHALSHPARSATATRWWIGAGLAIGVAMASKFTAVLVPVGLSLTILVVPALRPRLREPGPWLAVVVASLVMVPVLLWNASHDWIAFRFQLGHGLGSGAKESLVQRELNLVGGQALLVTPILFGLLLGALVRAVREEPRRRALAGVALFCLAFFVFSATRKNVEANWPAIAWVPAVVLLAAARPGERSAWERRALRLAAALSALLLAHVVRPLVALPGSRDPVNQAHGWTDLATAVAQRQASLAAATPSDMVGPSTAPLVAANRYQDAAMLAFHLLGHPQVPSLNLGGRPNQYDLWTAAPDRLTVGGAMLLVLELPRGGGTPPAIAALSAVFPRITPGDTVALTRDGRTVARRQLWTLTGWTGTWPSRP